MPSQSRPFRLATGPFQRKGIHGQIIVGVDTHKSNHVAVAIGAHGARLGSMTIPTTRKGYKDLQAWASQLAHVKVFGIEGTGSCGAGLSRDLQAKGYKVLNAVRPDRDKHLATAHAEAQTAQFDAWLYKG